MSQMLNETLRQSRKQMGLTQEQLAEKVHVSRQTISNWETGRASPDYEMIIQLAQALQTPLTELLGVESAEQDQEEPAAAPQEDATPAEQETPALQEPMKRPKWHAALAFAAALVLMLAGALGYQQWASRPVPAPYPPEWFMEEAPVTEGQGRLVVSVPEAPVKAVAAGEGWRWEFNYHVQETNGIAVTIDSLTEYLFFANGGWSVSHTPGTSLADGLHRNVVGANAVRMYITGDSSTEDMLGRGAIMNGTDANGNPVTARCYVAYQSAKEP